MWPITSNKIDSWQTGYTIGAGERIEIACQGYFPRNEIFGEIVGSMSGPVLFEISIFLILYRCTRLLLRPLRMPYAAQIIAGYMVGPIFGKYMDKFSMNKPALLTISTLMGYIGFFLHLFLTGLELNLRKLTKVGKKSFIISFAGFATSGGALYILNKLAVHLFAQTQTMLLVFSASNYLMSTSSHLNDLGIFNSKLGQLASSVAMIIDMLILLRSIVEFYIIDPIFVYKGADRLQATVVLYYAGMFLVVRPLIVYIVSLKREGKPMKQFHFVVIVVLVLLLALLGEIFNLRFSPFLLALTLPEEPLATVLTERLDPFASSVLFPFYLMTRGMNMGLDPEGFKTQDIPIVLILVVGYTGKFLGTFIASLFLGLPYMQAIALSLILAARGVLDMSTLDGLLEHALLTKNEYTIAIAHSLISMGALLPIAKFLYEPSRQYSTIMRNNVIDYQQSNETLIVLVCIHKEESLPGLMCILKVCHSTPEKPISIIALQLLQQTGHCAMPIMAPLHQISSISALRSNIDRCTSIVNSFLHLERETERRTRAQHFVAMSPYATMHNDICNLAYEKTVGLVLIPFHTIWAPDGSVKESSLSIREVNNMVLQKASCSVGIFIDRSNLNEEADENRVYRILVVFIGGADDYEALAYSTLFAEHPNVRLDVIWFKSPIDGENELENDVIKQFHKSCNNNERISLKEVIVNSGAETIQHIVSMKDQFDLVMTGKSHNLSTTSLVGLSDGWTEYPELGVLADIFASSDFCFSVLVVQQEPQTELNLDF